MKKRGKLILKILILFFTLLSVNPMKIEAAWEKNNKGWWWQADDGSYPTSKWEKINGRWYYFNNYGYMQTGWQQIKGKWYYLNSDGVMQTGWQQIKGKWYYLNSDGVMQMGWQQIKGKWYYLNSDGVMQTGWQQIKGKWYYLNSDGVMQTGWQQIKGKWYYLNSDGIMQTGWLKLKNDWYYLDNNGVMQTSKWIGNSYVDQDGKWKQSGWRYVNGYKLYYNEKGEVVQDVRNIIGKQSSYVIKVNKQQCITTVYAKDGDNGYIIPVVAFICSPGEDTPTGTFYTPQKYRWHQLYGNVWGQWNTRITGSILFHSVYYTKYQNNNSLSVKAYNKLGSKDSMGCIRLTAGDAKWVYDNCSLKTKVVIYNSSAAEPLTKPTAYKLSSSHTWDPTDPNMKWKCTQNGCH